MLKREFNIISNPLFKQSNQVVEAVVVELKRQGFAKVEHHEPILTEDLAKIYLSYDPSSPNQSLCSILFGSALCFTLFAEGDKTFAFTRDSRFQLVLTEQDENTTTWMNSTKITDKTMTPQGMEECTKTRKTLHYVQ